MEVSQVKNFTGCGDPPPRLFFIATPSLRDLTPSCLPGRAPTGIQCSGGLAVAALAIVSFTSNQTQSYPSV